MLTYDKINLTCYFKIHDKCIGNLHNYNKSPTIRNDKNFITFKKNVNEYKEYIIIIPTYIKHFNFCLNLLISIEKYVLDLEKINVYVILSSLSEYNDFIKLEKNINFKINIIIYDEPLHN